MGCSAASQIHAFEDTWHWDIETKKAYDAVTEQPGKVSDVVLDPFCGCGTTIDAAEKLGRDWIGIDVTQLAISLIKNRLQDTYGSRMKFVSGGARPPRAQGLAPSLNPSGASDETSAPHHSPAPVPTTRASSAAPEAGAFPGTSLVRIIGEPTTPNEAGILAEQDKYQFQWWVLGLVGARPVEQKKGADHGIDSKILFRDDPKAAKPERIIQTSAIPAS